MLSRLKASQLEPVISSPRENAAFFKPLGDRLGSSPVDS